MVAPRLAFEPFFVILLTDFRNNKNQNALKRNYYSVTIMYNQQQYDYAQQAAAMWSQYWQQASTMQQQQGNGQQVQIMGNHGGFGTALTGATFATNPSYTSLAGFAGPFPSIPANSNLLPMGGVTGFNGLLGSNSNSKFFSLYITNPQEVTYYLSRTILHLP